ncbi:MAG: ABC transporter permease subunit [Treponema sp.]|nr:ABC transporter permease subunit [Treponema sp.]
MRDAPYALAGILILLLAWESAARLSGSPLIIPGPVLVLGNFCTLVQSKAFWLSLLNSFWRVLLGIFIAAPLGLAAGIGSGLDRRAGALLKPLFQVIAATPVMSVILIAFLALGQERTPVFTAFLMVFPLMAANTSEGIRAVDPGFAELFALYRLSRRERFRYLYLPSIGPFVLAGLRSALSLCWKVVVAAEVLVQPLRALGTGMQQAKAQLETAELFAWTGGTVLAAALTQVLLSAALAVCRASRQKFERRRS